MQYLNKILKGDRQIWIIVGILSLFSVMAVYSSTGALAMRHQAGDTEHYLIKHAGILLFGLGLMFIAHRVPQKYYSRISQVAIWLSIPVLFYTLFFGNDIHDARRWITIPFLGLSFQTSDLAKFALIMYTARLLSKKQHIIHDFDRAFRPIILPVIIVCALIVPADLSTAVLLFATCLLLMFIGRVRVKHLVLAIAGGVAALLIVVALQTLSGDAGRSDTWKQRISNYWDGSYENDYQVVQANIAIADGGLTGVGPGKSRQRNFLPQSYSDYIYAIIIEEYGLLGGGLVMALYLWFLHRCILIFRRTPHAFGALLAVGLGFSLVIQALMNMTVTVGLIPVTGLTLPLISMGGTSLLFTAAAIGIILSVSSSKRKQLESVNL